MCIRDSGGNGGDIYLTSYRENLLSLFRLVSDGGSGGPEGTIGSGKNPNVGTVIMGAIINSVLGTDTSKAGRSGLEGRVRKGLMKFDQFKSDMSLYIGPKLADRLKP